MPGVCLDMAGVGQLLSHGDVKMKIEESIIGLAAIDSAISDEPVETVLARVTAFLDQEAAHRRAADAEADRRAAAAQAARRVTPPAPAAASPSVPMPTMRAPVAFQAPPPAPAARPAIAAAVPQTAEGWKAEFAASAELQRDFESDVHYASWKAGQASGRVRIFGGSSGVIRHSAPK